MTTILRRDDPQVAKDLELSLDACIKEGVCAQIMIGIYDYYLIPLALFLKASTLQVGFLVSIPHFLSALSQFAAARIVKMAGSRRELLLKGIAVQAILLIPIPLLTFIHLPHKLEWLLMFVTMFRVLGSIVGPPWGSIVSDYLPEDKRGQYFGRRAQIVGVSGIIGMSLCGGFLSWMNKFSEAKGLCLIFMLAAVCRFFSYYYMTKLIELPHPVDKSDHFTFWMFIRRFRQSNFVKFIFYIASMTFATQLAAAYFSVYMLKELHFGYFTYMAISMASVLAGLIAFPIWGRHADEVGNAKILKLTGFLVSFIPIFWIFTKHPLVLIVIEMFSGFVWGGFNLCATNFIFDAVRPSKRVRCLSYFNLINGIALFGGASLGGYLAYRLPPLRGMSPLLSLFLLSAVVRLLANLILSGHFQEVREKYQKVNSSQLFISVLGVRSILGRNLEWGIFPVIKRLFIRRYSSTQN